MADKGIVAGTIIAPAHALQHAGAAALSRHVQLLAHIVPGSYHLRDSWIPQSFQQRMMRKTNGKIWVGSMRCLQLKPGPSNAVDTS